MNNRKHPYERNTNTNKYYNKREVRKYIISDDFLTAHYFIHPHSMHNTDIDLFEKPIEVGCLLSQSKYYYLKNFELLSIWKKSKTF